MATALAMPQAAQAEIKVGVTIAATGSAAALGGPARNTFTEPWPKEIAGEKITVILLDDASDPGQATTNARRLVTEDKVDVLVGSSITPSSMAVAGVALCEGIQSAPVPFGAKPERARYDLRQEVQFCTASDGVRIAYSVAITNLLPRVSVPTLVLHCRDDAVVPFEDGRLLAAGIRGCRLVALEGRNHIILEGDPGWCRLLHETRRFLAD